MLEYNLDSSSNQLSYFSVKDQSQWIFWINMVGLIKIISSVGVYFYSWSEKLFSEVRNLLKNCI